MNDLSRLRTAFETFSDLPDDEWNSFTPILKVKTISNGQSFIQLGDLHHPIGFVLNGLFKVSYINPDGQKFIRNFCPENNFVSSYTSAMQNEPAEVEIQAIEESAVIYFSYQDLLPFFDRHKCWDKIGRKITEKYFSFREGRERQFLTMNGLERYKLFLDEFDPIVRRIKQSDVAAYIGVTPESLSRLLKENKK